MGFKSSIPTTGRDFYFSPAGKSDNSGLSPEVPVKTPNEAIDLVNALSQPPSDSDAASIDAAITGTYSSSVVVPEFVTCNSRFASIITTDPITLTCEGRHTVTWGALLNLSAGGTVLKIDGDERIAVEVNALVTSGDNSIGIDITGSVDEIFIALRIADLGGDGSILIDHTADSATSVEYNIETIRFENINQTIINYNDTVGTTAAVFNISSVQSDPAAASITGSTVINAIAGTLVVDAEVLSGETIANVADGANLSLDALVVFGDTLVSDGGIAVYKSIGVITGSLDTTGSGTLQVTVTNLFGNVTTVGTGGVSVKCDQLIGDITIGSGTTAYMVIDSHTGTLTNNGTINGIVNGVLYGNWQQAVGYVFTSWGGNLQTTGRHPAINGQSNAAQITGLGIDSSAQIPADGTIDVLTYYSATGDNTTQFQIILNGAVAHTFTCDAAYGRETGIGVPVAVGDNVAIRYISGTTPASGIYSMYIK